MSRTDAHRPYDVWLADEWWARTEVHRHEGGVCTLPGDPRELGSWRQCHWDTLPGRLPCLCGCAMCTARISRRRAIKSTRVKVRALVRAAARGADLEELDTLEAAALNRARRW